MFGKAAKPVEGVSFTEVMVFRGEVIKAKVVASPFEIDLRKVEGGGGGASDCGGDGEKTGVRKGVEDCLAGFDEGTEGCAVVTLINEDALRISGVKGELAFEPVFESREGFGCFGATDVDGGFFLMLVEVFPIEWFLVCAEMVAKILAEVGASG